MKHLVNFYLEFFFAETFGKLLFGVFFVKHLVNFYLEYFFVKHLVNFYFVRRPLVHLGVFFICFSLVFPFVFPFVVPLCCSPLFFLLFQEG